MFFKGKEIKRASLNEIVDYISSSTGVLAEPVYSYLTKMVEGFEPSFTICHYTTDQYIILEKVLLFYC